MSGQSTFEQFGGRDLSPLTATERKAYLAIERGDTGVREFQREHGYSSPGTVSNLLSRARNKLGIEDGGRR